MFLLSAEMMSSVPALLKHERLAKSSVIGTVTGLVCSLWKLTSSRATAGGEICVVVSWKYESYWSHSLA